ncbi:MAG: F0F1 ATP synthase subunit B [Mycoplasmataceae bacterium]|nr:F0F1 ATP synthase subunit B [Mycoplasmataceae bacterium]
MTGCAPVDQSDIMNALFPNLWVFLSHVFASVVLITICIWLVWKPTKTSLEKRRNYIAKEIKDAEQAKKEAFDRLAQAEQEKIQAHSQAALIVENASKQAYHQKEQIEGEAQQNVKRMYDDAKNESVKLQENIKANMHKQIVDIAFDATESLLQEKIDETTNRKFIEEFIKNLPKKEKRG